MNLTRIDDIPKAIDTIDKLLKQDGRVDLVNYYQLNGLLMKIKKELERLWTLKN